MKWEEELRGYFDKYLKPKKATMQNLDRELLVDFVRKQKEESTQQERKRCAKIFGSHESPHIPSNCRMCKIEAV